MEPFTKQMGIFLFTILMGVAIFAFGLTALVHDTSAIVFEELLEKIAHGKAGPVKPALGYSSL